jgi:putative ABC transport system substrate-binding protein
MTSDFRRRDFIALVGGATAWPLATYAQGAERKRRIGVVMSFPGNDPEAPIRIAAFLQRLQELGWTDRRNVQIDYRLAGDGIEQARVVGELLALAPDILLVNGASILRAAQQATRSIPIVFVNVIDPVGQGLVQSIAHPGGNITGVSSVGPEMGAKWLHLLKEIAPNMNQVAIVGATTLGGAAGIERTIRTTAVSLGVKVIPFTARVADEIEHKIRTLGLRPSLIGPKSLDVKNTGLIVLPGALTRGRREQIISLAAQGNLPAIYPYRYYATSGGLMSYGADTLDAYRRAATYVDRILKGEKPADIPIQQEGKFELVINLEAASEVGLEVPAELLMRADEVIEQSRSFG